MTYRELYTKIKEILKRGGCDSPAFDAGCLLSHFSGITKGLLPLKGEEKAPEDLAEAIIAAAEQRALGRPLQYILGSWDFLSLTLEVGEGVLIPRPDTELLCETAAKLLSTFDSTFHGIEKPVVLDLCAGSGCVGLGVASLVPDVKVIAVELSEQAFKYLRHNCERYPEYDIKAIQADVLSDSEKFGSGFSAIVSNPPYIPSDQLPQLMREVRHEPEMALDGGDGLVFYRSIVKDWIPKLVDGGFCAVEVGVGQAPVVAEMFLKVGLCGVEIFKDLNGIERVVIGKVQ
jgi:release factor glutamine methyltransferase